MYIHSADCFSFDTTRPASSVNRVIAVDFSKAPQLASFCTSEATSLARRKQKITSLAGF